MRDYKRRTPRPFPGPVLFAVFIIALVLAMSSCTAYNGGPAYDPADIRDAYGHLPGDESHNDLGGFRDACGDLSGLLGDDC